MAYSTGSYTGINDALNQFATFAVAQGWTQNDLSDDSSKYSGAVFTGRRLHIQKSIGGTDYYFNFRSCSNQQVLEGLSSFFPYPAITGICCNGSTGYNVALAWDLQPGYTQYAYNNTRSDGGNVDDIKAAGGTYYFFAATSTLTAVFETDSTNSDWRMITVGVAGESPTYLASGGSVDRSVYADIGAGSGHIASYDGSTWYTLHGNPNSSWRMRGIIDAASTSSSWTVAGSLAGASVAYSPDAFRGNAQLAQSQLMAAQALSTESYPIGELEGVKFINMTNYINGQEVTYGTDTYKLFRIDNTADTGAAFLK